MAWHTPGPHKRLLAQRYSAQQGSDTLAVCAIVFSPAVGRDCNKASCMKSSQACHLLPGCTSGEALCILSVTTLAESCQKDMQDTRPGKHAAELRYHMAHTEQSIRTFKARSKDS